MTETSPLITMNPRQGEKKIGTVGLPLQGTRVKFMEQLPLTPVGKVDKKALRKKVGNIINLGECKGRQMTRA